MATNEINLTLKITESGDLKLVGKKAEQAAAGLDKAGKSARTADRNIKGAAQTSANGTKNFSKMAQGISGGIVPAYATLAAQIFAVSAAFNFLKDAGSLQLLQTGQVAYAAATGTSLRSLTKDIQRATEAQLGFRDAAQAAAIGTAAGLDPTQITNIAKAAKDASTVLGRDLTDSFNRLVRGITKAEPELLDELGIILRLDTATQRYADSLGVSADDLTAFQRSQAVANDVLAQAEEKYGRVLEVVGGGSNKFAQLSTAFEDIVNDLRNFAVNFLTPIATTLSEMPQLIAIAFAPFAAQVIGTALPGLDKLNKKLGEMAETAEEKSKEAGKSLKENLKNDDRVKESKVLQGALRKEVEMNSKARLEDVKAHQGSLLQKLKNGEELNNRQLGQIRENIKNQARGYNQLNATQKAAVHRTVNEVERANKLGATKIKGIWASTSIYVQTQLQNVGNTANSVFSKMVAFAQAAGAKIALALSAISWISLIVSLGALAVSFFRSGKEAEDSVPKYDYLKEKFSELTAETEKFIQVQNILNEEFENGNKAIEAFGKRLKTVSSGKLAADFGLGQGRKLGSGVFGRELSPVEAELKKAREAARGATLDIEKFGEAYIEAQNNVKEAEKRGRSDGGVLGISIGKVGAEASETRALAELNDARENGIKTLRDYIDSKGEDLTTAQAGLGILLDEKQVLQGLTNERFQQNSVVQEYYKSVENLNELEEEDIQTLLRKRDTVISLADQISRLTRLQTENDRLGSQFEQRLFPLDEYDRYIANLNQEIISTRALINTNQGIATPAEDERLRNQQARLALVEEISDAERKAARDIIKIDKNLVKSSMGKTNLVKQELRINANILKNKAKEDLLTKKIRAAQALINKDSEKYEEISAIAKENRTEEQQALIDSQSSRERLVASATEELELSKAKTAELERQLDLAAQIGDAALQAMESGLAREIAKVIKGEEKSLKDAILAIVKSIGEAIADELAKAAARGIMKFFGFKSAAEDMQEKMEAANLDNQNKMRQVNADAATDMEAAMNRAISKVPTATTAPGTTTSPTTGLPTTPECITICPDTANPTPLSEKCGCPTGMGEGAPGEERGFFGKLADAFGMGGVYDSIFSKKEPGGQKDPSGSGDIVKEQAEKVKQGAFDPFLESLGKLFDEDTPFLQGLGKVFQTGLQGFDSIFGDLLNGFMQVFGGSGGGGGFVSTLMTLFGFTAANGGIAKGGFRSMAYGSGGVVKQPTLGLVGEGRYNEAIVPLPDGKSIPVSMGKGAGQQNNVVINVNIDKDGNATQDEVSTGSDAARLGQAISVAVQRELLVQKRSGGMLNPYGVA